MKTFKQFITEAIDSEDIMHIRHDIAKSHDDIYNALQRIDDILYDIDHMSEYDLTGAINAVYKAEDEIVKHCKLLEKALTNLIKKAQGK